MRSSYRVGAYQAGEGVVVLRPHDDVSELPGVVFCHGAGGIATDALNLSGVPAQGRLCRRIVDSGRVMISADLGGPHGWGNDLSTVTRLTQAITHLRAQPGVSDGPVHILGISMGGLIGLVFAKAQPADVASVTAIIPVIDPEYVRANDVGGNAAMINAAYGGAYVDADRRATKNPSYFGPLGNTVPIDLWHASDDPYAPVASYEAFGETPLTTLHNVGALGHDDDAIAAVEIQAVLDFIAAHD